MDFGKAFTFAFEDEGWLRKLGIAGVITFIGMIVFVLPGIFYVTGYQVVVGRNVYNGQKHPLPEPDDVFSIMKDGLMVMIIGFLYTLPIMVIMAPLAIIGGIMSEQGDGAAVVASLFIFAASCLTILLSLGMALFLPGAIAQYIRTGDFAATFQIKTIWAEIVQPNLVNILLIVLATIAAQLMVSLALSISVITICGPILLMFPAMVWTSAFNGHLYGQLAAQVGGPNKADTFEFA